MKFTCSSPHIGSLSMSADWTPHGAPLTLDLFLCLQTKLHMLFPTHWISFYVCRLNSTCSSPHIGFLSMSADRTPHVVPHTLDLFLCLRTELHMLFPSHWISLYVCRLNSTCCSPHIGSLSMSADWTPHGAPLTLDLSLCLQTKLHMLFPTHWISFYVCRLNSTWNSPHVGAYHCPSQNSHLASLRTLHFTSVQNFCKLN